MAELRINERAVRILMAREGINSLEELARRSGVASNTCRNLFSGDGFRSRTIEQLAATLNANPIDLIEALSNTPPLVGAQGVAIAAS